MKTTRKISLGLAALVLAAGLVGADDAQAQLKVRASLTVPGLHVRVGDAPRVLSGHLHHGGCRCVAVRLTARDRRVARRLADWSGLPPRVLLDHRRHGLTWRAIGRAYDIPLRVVRAAGEARVWRGAKRSGHVHGACGRGAPRHGGRVRVVAGFDLR